MNRSDVIAIRKFCLSDQMDFGKFSGDLNPIHIDPIAARRTLHGVCIVHGMHAVLWALEQLTIKHADRLLSVKVRFSNPLLLDCETKCRLDVGSQKISLTQNNVVCVSIVLAFGDATPNLIKKRPIVSRLEANDVCFQSFSVGDQCDFKFYQAKDYKNVPFPNLSRIYGDIFVAESAALSQLVGMECPGKHSLFASVFLSLCDKNKCSRYKVVKMDERLDLIHLEVAAHSFNALLECFFRPKPVASIDYLVCQNMVGIDEFENVNALIIGGSRGLGECVAKLISAGGGRSFITYYHGDTDAIAVKQEINVSDGFCECLYLNIGDLEHININFEELAINQVYYFASPKISFEKQADYQIKKEEYLKFYCESFRMLAEKIVSTLDDLSFFYPSTVFIDEKKKGFEGYIQAKLAGEEICQELANSNPSIQMITARLPVLQTDQNQSISGRILAGDKNANVLLPYIRQMNDSNN